MQRVDYFVAYYYPLFQIAFFAILISIFIGTYSFEQLLSNFISKNNICIEDKICCISKGFSQILNGKRTKINEFGTEIFYAEELSIVFQ